ncbi:RNA polymerase sigma factor SigJ [Streptomyces sp. NPDC003691]
MSWDGRVVDDALTDSPTDVFERHRPLLTGVAYRMLGRIADAEDAVQDAWLRWTAGDRSDVAEPRAFLVRIVTRLALDRLRQLGSRRETYTGPWLPEPVLTATAPGPGGARGTVPDTADRAVLADTVSFAVLVVLESLSPAERAVFVLREAFGFPYAEIAAALDRSEAAVRQTAGRARRHVEERRARYDTDPARCREITERFLAAAAGGDLGELLALLAPGATLVGDGGGRRKAPRRVLVGADKIGRFLVGVNVGLLRNPELRPLEVNGVPSVLVLSGGEPDTVLQLGVVDGRIERIYILRNPDKFRAFAGCSPSGNRPAATLV